MTEDNHRVFICYSSKDEKIALGVVDFLEAEGLDCWISARDVPPGENYQETIVHSLEKSKGIVFLFSESSGTSGEIKKELSLAAAYKMPVFPLRLSPILPTGALRYELATRQWIDMFPDREQALGKLADTIRNVLSAGAIVEDDTARESLNSDLRPGAADGAPTAAAPVKKRTRTPRAPLVAPGSEQFEAIRALLARHIGPIAKVVVQKAATEARTPDDLCQRLAAHVSTPSDRATFLHAVRARLTVKSS